MNRENCRVADEINSGRGWSLEGILPGTFS